MWSKIIQPEFGIFTHIPVYSDITMATSEPEAYSKPCVTLAYSEQQKYLEIETCSDPWLIHNPGTIRNLLYLEP